jgi:hypothetical protein
VQDTPQIVGNWVAENFSATDFTDKHGFLNQSVKIREIDGKVLGKRQLHAMSYSPIWAKFRCKVWKWSVVKSS